MEDTMATTKKKAPAKKAAPKKPAAKAAKPKEDLVVFAFRLTEVERTAIHKRAGPRNATQFVRRVAVAFASEDDAWWFGFDCAHGGDRSYMAMDSKYRMSFEGDVYRDFAYVRAECESLARQLAAVA